MNYGIGAVCEDELCTCNQYYYNVTLPNYSIKCDKQIGELLKSITNKKKINLKNVLQLLDKNVVKMKIVVLLT